MTRFRRFQVGNRIRVCRADLWAALSGPKPSDRWESDGCSCSPDWWQRVPLWPACRLHDFAYSTEAPFGGSWASRREADRVFRENLLITFDIYEVPRLRASSLSWLYWSRTRLYGSRYYKGWHDSERPADLPWWQRVREVYGLFRPRDDAFDDAVRMVKERAA